MSKARLWVSGSKMSVLVETTAFSFVIDLHCKESPENCRNFLSLCGLKRYNLCSFFHVERNFIARTGDPTNTGSGNTFIVENEFIRDEFSPLLSHSKAGTVSMANDGRVHRNGSQFFITLENSLEDLDDRYTIIGFVAEGLQQLLATLNSSIVDSKKRPYEDVVIKRTHVLYTMFHASPKAPESPSPTEEHLRYFRFGYWKQIEREGSLTPEQLAALKAQEASESQALTLELLGDIPTNDAAPPDNILFVCKLNPVTKDAELKTVFSRFGKILQCNIIRDRATGRSQGFAFIEFATKEACEQAYLKMENAKVDGRCIHVDFSQSTSSHHKRGLARLKNETPSINSK